MKNFLNTLFAGVALTAASLESHAEKISINSENVQDYLKKSPDVIRKYEQKILDRANYTEKIPGDVRAIDLGNGHRAHVTYRNGKPAELSIDGFALGMRMIDGRDGQGINGSIDAIEFISEDGMGINQGGYLFHESTDNEGNKVVIVDAFLGQGVLSDEVVDTLNFPEGDASFQAAEFQAEFQRCLETM